MGWRGGYCWKGPEKVAKAGSGRGPLAFTLDGRERVAAFSGGALGVMEGARIDRQDLMVLEVVRGCEAELLLRFEKEGREKLTYLGR